MTELEKIRNAKLYIEKLARGINPINDAPVAEDELINDVHISRCFFFVAELLERFLATVGAEDAVAHRRLKKQPFSISEEQCGRFEYSPVPSRSARSPAASTSRRRSATAAVCAIPASRSG